MGRGAGLENAAHFLDRQEQLLAVHGGAMPGQDVAIEVVPTLARFDAAAILGRDTSRPFAIERLDGLAHSRAAGTKHRAPFRLVGSRCPERRFHFRMPSPMAPASCR